MIASLDDPAMKDQSPLHLFNLPFFLFFNLLIESAVLCESNAVVIISVPDGDPFTIYKHISKEKKRGNVSILDEI